MTNTAKQRAFNKAYLGLKSQGFARSENDKICLYRGPNGRRCAAGWLLPDSKYKSSLEGKGVNGLPPAIFGGAPKGLIVELQSAHDESMGGEDMRRRLVTVASDYGLTIPAA